MSAYRFYLYHPELKQPKRITDPIGWDSSLKTIERDPNWHGVFFKYTPKLQFIKDGKAIIQSLYEQYGFEAEIELFIYKRSTARKFEIDYRGRLNLTPGSLRIQKVYLTCNVDQTGFTQKLKNRQDVKVNLQSLLTQDGADITPFSNETVTIPMHSKVLVKSYNAKLNRGISFRPSEITSSKFIQIDFDGVTSNEIEEKFNIGTNVNTSVPVNLITLKEGGEYQFNLRFELSRYKTSFSVGYPTCEPAYEFLNTASYFDAYLQINDQAPELFSKSNFSAGSKESTVYTHSSTKNLKKGDKITIYIDVLLSLSDTATNHESLIFWGEGSSVSYEQPVITIDPGAGACIISNEYNTFSLVTGTSPSLSITPSSTSIEGETIYPATTVPFVLLHEAFDRVIHSITDQADSFRSSV
jgi:hypothetical protein